jgi:hypothetical protein
MLIVAKTLTDSGWGSRPRQHPRSTTAAGSGEVRCEFLACPVCHAPFFRTLNDATGSDGGFRTNYLKKKGFFR